MSTLKIYSVILLLLLSAASQATTLPQCAIGCARAAATRVGCALCVHYIVLATVVQCAATTSCSQAEKTEVSAILAGMCAAASASGPHSSPSFGSTATPSTSSGTVPMTSVTHRNHTNLSGSPSISTPLTTTSATASTGPSVSAARNSGT
ncbi:hypothetical protein DFH09DRAFT_1152933 [Mycena vulgaris]|nr:hypothetical protein DFH09DRAFT_1152933 [Mycena vulgaris]